MSVNSTIKPTIIQLESSQYIVTFLIKVLIVIRIIIIFRDIIHFQMYISDLIIEYKFKCLWALDSNALVKNKIKRVHNLENENITFLVSHHLRNVLPFLSTAELQLQLQHTSLIWAGTRSWKRDCVSHCISAGLTCICFYICTRWFCRPQNPLVRGHFSTWTCTERRLIPWCDEGSRLHKRLMSPRWRRGAELKQQLLFASVYNRLCHNPLAMKIYICDFQHC